MQAPRVLIADNDRAVAGLLAEVLRRLGCEVVQVADGAAAVAALTDGAFGVLVCDLDMPRLTGFEVVGWLAGRPRPPRVVVVTGYLDGQAAAALQAHAHVAAVLKKPFDLGAFTDLVRGLLAAAAVPSTDAGAG